MASGKRWGRVIGWGLAALVLAMAVVVAMGLFLAGRKADRVVQVDAKPLAYVQDAMALERGRYLYQTRGCVDCHGAAGTGREFASGGAGLRIVGPNITQAGVTKAYREVDWVRTLRHGVKPDGRAVRVMPAEDYARLTDPDLAALTAYVRSLPPAAGEAAVVELPLPARLAFGFGLIPDAVERVVAVGGAAAAPASTSPGAYAANMCIGCHGPGLSGGRIPGGPPDWPAAPNLTPGTESVMARYTNVEAFVAMMRSGRAPDGRSVRVMPFESLAKIDDTELRALHAHLVSLAPRAGGTR